MRSDGSPSSLTNLTGLSTPTLLSWLSTRRNFINGSNKVSAAISPTDAMRPFCSLYRLVKIKTRALAWFFQECIPNTLLKKHSFLCFLCGLLLRRHSPRGTQSVSHSVSFSLSIVSLSHFSSSSLLCTFISLFWSLSFSPDEWLIGMSVIIHVMMWSFSSLQSTQEEMTSRLSVLLTQEKVQQIQSDGLPKRDFEILYRTDCHNLCADFQVCRGVIGW